VQQLLARLRKEFRLLKGDDRSVHPRYQTMRAALDWSFDWLSEGEKSLFRRLGIFRGGWTLETIYACGVDESLDGFALLDQLWPLVDKSLVAVEFRGESQRYRLMEPVRQYALELLKEQGELEATAQRHARYFAEFAGREGSKWLKISDLEFVANIEEEIDNVRAALEWTLEQNNDPVLGAHIAANLGGFWFTQYYHEGLHWLEAAQSSVTFEAQPALSLGIAVHRMRSYAQVNLKETLRVAEEALRLADSVDEGVAVVRLFFFYGTALIAACRFGEAERAFAKALDLARRVDPFRVQYCLWGLARLNRKRGNAASAKEFALQMAEAHESAQLPGDRNRWIILSERALNECADGRPAAAIESCREALRATNETNDVLGGVQSEYLLGALLLKSGLEDEARACADSVLKTSIEELLPHGIAPALQLIGGVATHETRYDTAARLLGFAEANLKDHREEMIVHIEPEWFLGPLRERLGDQRLVELMAEGAAWPQPRAIEEARQDLKRQHYRPSVNSEAST
jgi:tetratricopeptide (TPR) repeat protein